MSAETLLTAAHRLNRKRSPENPDKQRARNKRWAVNNPEKRMAHAKAFRARNPDYRMDMHLRASYGITLAQRNALLAEQGNVCAICRSTETGRKNNRGQQGGWMVDHCHRTGVIRGIVCHPCNMALSMAKDSPERLRAMADYLEKPRTEIAFDTLDKAIRAVGGRKAEAADA